MVKSLRERIHEENIAVHRFEAKYYEVFHPEVYGKQEQKRIDSTLKMVDKLIVDNQRRALDFGAGTGNLTGKLLDMGYKVSAIDISAEMCKILKMKYKNYLEAKKLIIINSPVEDLSFNKNEFVFVRNYHRGFMRIGFLLKLCWCLTLIYRREKEKIILTGQRFDNNASWQLRSSQPMYNRETLS